MYCRIFTISILYYNLYYSILYAILYSYEFLKLKYRITQLASVFEQIAIYQAPIYVVGDLNIRLDRQCQFNHTDHSEGIYYGLGHNIHGGIV